MTATRLDGFSCEDIPLTLKYGTGYKRKRYYINFSNASTSYTLNLATYDAGLTSIDAIEGYSLDGAGTTNVAGTWSTTTFTFSHAGTGVLVLSGYF